MSKWLPLRRGHDRMSASWLAVMGGLSMAGIKVAVRSQCELGPVTIGSDPLGGRPAKDDLQVEWQLPRDIGGD